MKQVPILNYSEIIDLWPLHSQFLVVSKGKNIVSLLSENLVSAKSLV